MWEWLAQLLGSGAGTEALAGELAMKAAPDFALSQMNTAVAPPAPVTSWDSIVNPAMNPMQTVPPAVGMTDIMPTLPGNNFITMNPPSAQLPPPADPYAPGYGPSTTAPIVPETTYTGAPNPAQQRPSAGLTPEQIMGMMKMLDGGQQQAPRIMGGGGGSAARPPNQVVMNAPMAAGRQSLADLLKLRR